MRPSVLYRAAAVLFVLFALGHQFGFRSVDPAWRADAVVGAMRMTSFSVQGFTRSYWDFFSGFGFSITALLLFSAVLAWELGRLPIDMLRPLSRALWAFAVCHTAMAVMMWAYFFTAPGAFASLIALCLIFAAIRVNREQLI